MADILTLVQIICLVLLLIGAPIYEFLKLKRRAERAERMANGERLRRRTVERELEQLRRALSDLERRTVGAMRNDATSCADANNQGTTDSFETAVEFSTGEVLPDTKPKTSLDLTSDENHDRSSDSSGGLYDHR